MLRWVPSCCLMSTLYFLQMKLISYNNISSLIFTPDSIKLSVVTLFVHITLFRRLVNSRCVIEIEPTKLQLCINVANSRRFDNFLGYRFGFFFSCVSNYIILCKFLTWFPQFQRTGVQTSIGVLISIFALAIFVENINPNADKQTHID